MKNNYLTLNDSVADIFKGHSKTRLKNGISNIINNNELSNLNYNDIKNKETLKICGWKHIKDYKENGTIENCDTIDVIKEYTDSKSIKYMQKEDIIIPVSSQKNTIDIVYIKDTPKEKIIYDETVWVIRIIDENIDSFFVYIMLLSTSIQNGLIRLKDSSDSVITKMTKEILSSVQIINIELQEQLKIVKEYNKLQNSIKNFENKIDELQNSKTDKSVRNWTKK